MIRILVSLRSSFTIVIYDRNTFIPQATVLYKCLFVLANIRQARIKTCQLIFRRRQRRRKKSSMTLTPDRGHPGEERAAGGAGHHRVDEAEVLHQGDDGRVLCAKRYRFYPCSSCVLGWGWGCSLGGALSNFLCKV
jgi:hypothetical protein